MAQIYWFDYNYADNGHTLENMLNGKMIEGRKV